MNKSPGSDKEKRRKLERGVERSLGSRGDGIYYRPELPKGVRTIDRVEVSRESGGYSRGLGGGDGVLSSTEGKGGPAKGDLARPSWVEVRLLARSLKGRRDGGVSLAAF